LHASTCVPFHACGTHVNACGTHAHAATCVPHAWRHACGTHVCIRAAHVPHACCMRATCVARMRTHVIVCIIEKGGRASRAKAGAALRMGASTAGDRISREIARGAHQEVLAWRHGFPMRGKEPKGEKEAGRCSQQLTAAADRVC